MRTIIAGSRDIEHPFEEIAKATIDSGFNITQVISGTARGVDKSGEEWAKCFGIKIREFPAFWVKYGKSAGYRRNEQMANAADALIAIWDGKSKGTKNMIDIAKKKKLKVYVHMVPKNAKKG